MFLSSLTGGDRASPLAFWIGVLAVTVGVVLHLPMYAMAADMGYILAGMEMDNSMLFGMVLIVLGTVASGYGLLPVRSGGQGVMPAPADLAPPAAAAEGTERVTRAHVGLMVTLSFALVIDTMKPATLGFIVPGMAKEYGLTRPSVAILVFFALTGTALGSLIWGVIADRLGRRAAILLAAIMFIGTAICGAMPSYTGNIVMCFLMGLSAGGMLPITFTLLAELMPARHRGWSLVLLGALGPTAGYVAASGCAALLEPHFGWRIMWFLGLPTGVLLVALNSFIPESPSFLLAHGRVDEARRVIARFGMRRLPSQPRRAARSLTPGLLQRGLTGVTVALNFSALAWGLVNFGLLLWLPNELRARGFSVVGSDKLLVQSALLALPTAAVVAFLYAKWSTRGTLILFSAVTAAGLLGMSAIGTGMQVAGVSPVILIALLMIGTNGTFGVLMPYSAENYPVLARGRGTGFVAGSSKFGGIIVQVVTMAAMVPALATAAVVLVLPVLASAALVAGFGAETRGRRLDEPEPAAEPAAGP